MRASDAGTETQKPPNSVQSRSQVNAQNRHCGHERQDGPGDHSDRLYCAAKPKWCGRARNQIFRRDCQSSPLGDAKEGVERDREFRKWIRERDDADNGTDSEDADHRAFDCRKQSGRRMIRVSESEVGEVVGHVSVCDGVRYQSSTELIF
ncbi:hypothetical protein GCM10009000_051100 [Halobacterium noricense]